MFNSRYNTNELSRVAAVQDTEEYQNLINELTNGGDRKKNLGIIDLDGDSDNHMWSSTQQHWSDGNYPSTTGVGKQPEEFGPQPYRHQTPYAHFQEILDGLPTTISREEAGPNHPAITEKRVVFGSIKNYDSGRHFDIHLFYEPDGPDSFKLKASTHTPRQWPGAKRSIVNVHDDHEFDAQSGLWHKPSDPSSPTKLSYNPIDLIRNAPADFASTTSEWGENPTHSLGFCKTCHRFPEALHRMLKLMQPDRCTACGQKGRIPHYAWEPGTNPNYEPGNASSGDSTAFRDDKAQTLICGNVSCDNHNLSVAHQLAFIDENYNVIYPPSVRTRNKERFPGAQAKNVYLLTNSEKAKHKEEFEDLTTVKRVKNARDIETARLMGDLSENGDYQAAKDEQGQIESRIHDLEYRLKEGNHRIISDEEARQIDQDEGSRVSREFGNDQFADIINKIGQDKVRQISLPISNLVCDHEDCPDNDMPIATNIQLTPETELPCVHCGRGEKDGVKVLNKDVDGYVRCNPLEYGANKCAPVPSSVKDPRAYLGWFKPDPTHKFPSVKRDTESGLGILFQRDEEEQDRNNPEGLYPGAQQILTPRPAGGTDPRGHGIESMKDYFTFRKGGHKPWPWLGMTGRSIAKNVDRIGKRHPDVTKRRAEERIQPDAFKELIKTPVVGDTSDLGLDGFDFDKDGFNFDDVKLLAPELAKDHEGNVIHPDLTEDDWREIHGGILPSEIPTVGKLHQELVKAGEENGQDFPVKFRKESRKKFRKENNVKLSIAEDDPNFDPDDYEYIQKSSIPELDIQDDSFGYDPLHAPLSGEEIERHLDDASIDCPTCHGDSKYNKLENAAYVDPHCENCKDGDTECSSTNENKLPHCAGCKHAKGSCGGRARFVWRNQKAICPSCLNNGKIAFAREHCRECKDNKKCKGPNKANNIHCTGCAEHDKQSNGEDHDTTPGVHARLMEIPSGTREDISSGNIAAPPPRLTYEETFGTTENAMSNINQRLRNEPIDYNAQGIDPNLEHEEALDFAGEEAAGQRSEDVESGRVYELTPLEIAGRSISVQSPVTALQSEEFKSDPEITRSLEKDLEEFRRERPTRPVVEKDALFYSPDALSREESIREETPIKEVKEDDQDHFIEQPKIINNTPVATIEHDENCKKCNKGIIIADVVGPGEMRRINGEISNGIANIRKTVSDPEQQKKAIMQLQADAYKCKG